MLQAGFEKQFPEPLRCWITYAPRRWPGPDGWWLDLAREQLVDGERGARAFAASDAEEDLSGFSDVTYLPPAAGVANWWRQDLRRRLDEAKADPIVQFFPGEDIEAGGGVSVIDLTPALLPVRLSKLAEVPTGAHCCWPLIPGISTGEELVRGGLEVLVRAGVTGVQPVVPSLTALVRRKLGDLTNRRGYQELFHGAPPDARGFVRLAADHGLAPWLERPDCGRSGRALKNRRVAARLHSIGELILRTDGSVDESLTFYRAGRWADAATLDIEDLVRSGNLELVPEVSHDCAREIGSFVAGLRSEFVERLEIEYRGEGASA